MQTLQPIRASPSPIRLAAANVNPSRDRDCGLCAMRCRGYPLTLASLARCWAAAIWAGVRSGLCLSVGRCPDRYGYSAQPITEHSFTSCGLKQQQSRHFARTAFSGVSMGCLLGGDAAGKLWACSVPLARIMRRAYLISSCAAAEFLFSTPRALWAHIRRARHSF